MNHTAAALTAGLDEAIAWLEVHPPTHPGERAVASALVAALPGEDNDLGRAGPRDRQALARTGPGSAHLTAPTARAFPRAAVRWMGTGEAAEPYRDEVDGDEWLVRVNDWPADPTVYTLVVNGRDAFGFDGWPVTWTRP